jgi:hypothetical protein
MAAKNGANTAKTRGLPASLASLSAHETGNEILPAGPQGLCGDPL